MKLFRRRRVGSPWGSAVSRRLKCENGFLRTSGNGTRKPTARHLDMFLVLLQALCLMTMRRLRILPPRRARLPPQAGCCKLHSQTFFLGGFGIYRVESVGEMFWRGN